jgi:plasmid stabilization system protein ParE
MIIYSRDARHDIARLRSFLDQVNPGAAQRATARIFKAIDKLQDFPNRGRRMKDTGIRQIMIRFGASGYVVRYATLPETKDILVVRIWHAREARS